MSQQRPNVVYQYRQWQVHLGRRELLASGVPIPIGSRAFEVLELLVRSANQLVTKDVLMERVWKGAMIGENTLHGHISAIRKALGRDRAMLKTASGRGYRLLGDWIQLEGVAEAPACSPLPARTFQSNLPETALELIGRAIAVGQIEGILSAHRAITLTGPAGIGKTALALHVAHRVSLTFEGDVRAIELASLSDPGLVPAMLAEVLDLDPGADEISAEAVARAIGDRPILLVLDNCEHVVDAAAMQVETILRLCPRASVLATSQEPLRVAGECVYRVPPLDVPRRDWGEQDDVLKQSAALLFVVRTQALNPAFAINPENIHSIVAICHRLDGIPLALELAAARAATLGVQYVASHLEDRFDLLTNGRRTALPKHRTLRAALDWSYGLLPEIEQALLGRLSIFDAGFTLEAASAVMSDYPESAVLAGIANLVEKSFVVPNRSTSGGRWVLPETMRAYALEKLVQSGEAAATAQRHAIFHSRRLQPGEPCCRNA